MTEFSHCPDCSLPLGKERTKCRCGWVTPQAQEVKTNPNHVPCAADKNCRYTGRMQFEGFEDRQRVCVVHYIFLLDKKRGVIA